MSLPAPRADRRSSTASAPATPTSSTIAAAGVVAGGTWLDPRVQPRVLERIVAQPTAAHERVRALATLSPREREVLDLVCLGASNAEIAGALRTAERTVKSQVSSVLQKLGVRDRAAAVIAAYEGGWRRT